MKDIRTYLFATAVLAVGATYAMAVGRGATPTHGQVAGIVDCCDNPPPCGGPLEPPCPPPNPPCCELPSAR